MKKVIILIISMICSVGTAIASPVLSSSPIEVNGEYRMWIRSLNDHYPMEFKANYGEARLLLNFKAKIDDSVSAFVRVGERGFWGQQPFSNSNNWNVSNLDHYGVAGSLGSWNVSVGRQAVKLGQGGIISTGSDFGYNPYFDGIIASKKFGNVAMNFIGGNTTTNGTTAVQNPPAGSGILAWNSNYKGAEWYGADASAKLGDRVTVGAAYAHEKLKDQPGVAGVNYFSINTSVQLGGPFSVNAEWIKSGVSTNNQAYSLVGIYHRGKDTVALGYADTNRNAIDQYTSITQGGWQYVLGLPQGITGLDWKATFVNYIHDVTSKIQFRLLFEDIQSAGQPHNHELGAGFDYKF